MKTKSTIAPEAGGRHKTVTTKTGPAWARLELTDPSTGRTVRAELTFTQAGQLWLELRNDEAYCAEHPEVPITGTHLVALSWPSEGYWAQNVDPLAPLERAAVTDG